MHGTEQYLSGHSYTNEAVIISSIIANTAQTLTIDGSKVQTNSFAFNPETPTTLTIGGSTIDTFSNIQIQEILIFDEEISEVNRIKMNLYLADKWGLGSKMDSDGDTYTDNDAFPLDPDEWLDTDNDGIGNNSDPDDDNDNYSDDIELAGTSPTLNTEFPILDLSTHVDTYISDNDVNSVESNLILWLDAAILMHRAMCHLV